MKYKLTVIFRGTKQVGFETWTDYATTCNVPLTKEQEQLLTPPKDMHLAELILEEVGDE